MEPTVAPAGKFDKLLYGIINGVLIAVFLTVLVLPHHAVAWDALLLLLAALGSLLALHRQLPWQNVLLAAAIIGGIGGIAHGLTTKTGMPFGPLVYDESAGEKMFGLLPWTIPWLWLVMIFSARGLGRLILRPWRKVRSYGFWLIGLTAILAALFDFALEPWAAGARHFWLWQPTKMTITWFGATPVNFLAVIFVTLIILAFATPTLIRKQPGGRSVPDYHPGGIWMGALVLFAVGSARAGFWPAVMADAAILVVTTVLAVRGTRW
jgi:uncharacterized membrane protein